MKAALVAAVQYRQCRCLEHETHAAEAAVDGSRGPIHSSLSAHEPNARESRCDCMMDWEHAWYSFYEQRPQEKDFG